MDERPEHAYTNEAFLHAHPCGTRIGAVVLERAIGQGAWGIVYEGQHDKWGRVAVKEYFPSTYASRASRGSVGSSAPQWQEAVRRGLERFGNEGRALTSIRHENVVPVYDYIEQDDVALLVMEFVEGETLTAAIAAGRFADPAAVTALGATLVDTLAAIHAKNILHRDIAPDNIMIRPDGSPVLIDFGGAAAAVANATRSTQNIVKDGYSPPEQYDTSANPTFPVGPWSDIYATAAVLYRTATGNEPAVSSARLLAAGMKSAADPLVALATLKPAGYAPEWLAAVDSGLALLPRDRPQNAPAWRKCFERIAPVAGPRKNGAVVGASAAVAVAALVAGAFAFPHLTAGTQPTPAPAAATSAPAVSTAHVTHKPAAHRPAGATAQPRIAQSVPAYPGQQPYAGQPAQQQQLAPQRQMAPQQLPQQPLREARNPVQATRVASRSAQRPAPEQHAAPVAAGSPGQSVAQPTAAAVSAASAVAAAHSDVVQSAAPVAEATDAPATSTPVALVATPEPAATPETTDTPAPTPEPVVLACPSGFVWREATASDHVCVTPAQRTLAAQQNAMASARISATDRTYGANTCASGFVWRVAYSGDTVCVTPDERSVAASENANAPPQIRTHFKRARSLKVFVPKVVST